jgi:hypothetical protein
MFTNIKPLIRVLALLFFVTASHCIFGQFGARTQYLSANVSAAQDESSTHRGAGYEVGVNYWFRLKNLRIEFFPEINYGSVSVKATEVQAKTQIHRFGAALPVSIYPLELKGDCKCPTFSKQNDLFKKGFFLQIVPTMQRTQSTLSTTDQSPWEQQLSLGLGAGLDIGVSDLVTVTPLVHYFSSLYNSAPDDMTIINDDVRIGIRAIVRLDYH